MLPEKIVIDERIASNKPQLRGVYGIFSDHFCLYVGKSYDIYKRFFMSNGHLHYYVTGKRRNKLVENLIETALQDGKEVQIKVLQEVPYQGDNYAKDLQRLASAENYFIDYYQQLNQCLEQVPEGNHLSKETWEKKYKK